ncbi:hypothetical protein C8R44DRAFT_891194 [Mycena epipterygia]|nr:hypothetical protein C8R44DRAFT_891194 [Mycena epipterygia]
MTFLGAVGMFGLGRCLNDLTLRNYDPRAPIIGDERIIIQSVLPWMNILYLEVYMVNPVPFGAVGAWVPVPALPPTLNFTVPGAGGGRVPLPQWLAPAAVFVNPFAAFAAPVISVIPFFWWPDLILESTAPPPFHQIIYLKHCKRARADVYLRAHAVWLGVNAPHLQRL